jgi:hypothetical protein
MTNRLDRFLARMTSSEVAQRSDLRGCSEAEITELEKRYGLRLPETYRWYLRTMGHASGRLFTSDHLAVFYPYVLEMTGDVRSRKLSKPSDAQQPPPPEFVLPGDALLIAGRLDLAWEFIRCANNEDSPVWHFDESTWKIKQNHGSVAAWLECWCGYAEDAIAHGYFRDNPKGTTP